MALHRYRLSLYLARPCGGQNCVFGRWRRCASFEKDICQEITRDEHFCRETEESIRRDLRLGIEDDGVNQSERLANAMHVPQRMIS